MKKNNQAQSILEYTVVIVCIVAALLAMQIYFKRAKEGSLRQAADSLGQQYAPKRAYGDSNLTNYELSQSISETKNEVELGIDLNGDGHATDADVYGTVTTSNLIESNTTQLRNETVTKFKDTLFED
jgi:hypothetical protein